MTNLTTSGSSSIQTIAQSDIKSVMQTWGLDIDLFDKTYHNVQVLIRSAVDEGAYIAQGLSYNWSRCQDHTSHHTCLSTLMVVVRVSYVVGGYVWRAEVGHAFMYLQAPKHTSAINACLAYARLAVMTTLKTLKYSCILLLSCPPFMPTGL